MFLLPLVLSPTLGADPAQTPPEPSDDADAELIVTASRASGGLGRVPASATALDFDDIAADRPTLELGEALSQVPGVYVANRTNFAQDSRISIRGFGARSAFGVRGIRVLLDGIPLTLPDGQSQLDSIDPANLGRIEVLRGPAGTAYGNASGGVLTLTTRRAATEGVEVDADTTVGSFGLWKATGAVRSRSDRTDASFFASRTQLRGWRDQSGTEQVVAQAHVATWLAPALRLTTNVHFVDAPRADDPGGLTSEDAERDPRAASEVNRDSGTGEALTHLQAGTRLVGTIGSQHQLDVVAHAGMRTFDAAIPFRTVQFDRDFYGGVGTWRWATAPAPVQSTLVVGAEAQGQDDDRRNEGNDGGRPDGTLTLSQRERASAVGAFVQERLSFDERVVLLGSARYDRVAFRVDDRLLDDGDASGRRTFEPVTGQGGVLLRVVDGLETFANLSQSFETPTVSELVVAGGDALDPDLRPQRALQIDVGARARARRLAVDASAFVIELRDELLRQEDDEGRAFFTNVGRSRRLGAEALVRLQPVDDLDLVGSYTWLRAEFRDDREGQLVPGLPAHLGFVRAVYTPGTCAFAAEAELIGAVFADDANAVRADPAALVGARAGCALPVRGRWAFRLAVGIRNALGVRFVDNVRINAFGDRFFEPGPPQTVYARIALSRRPSGARLGVASGAGGRPGSQDLPVQ